MVGSIKTVSHTLRLLSSWASFMCMWTPSPGEAGLISINVSWQQQKWLAGWLWTSFINQKHTTHEFRLETSGSKDQELYRTHSDTGDGSVKSTERFCGSSFKGGVQHLRSAWHRDLLRHLCPVGQHGHSPGQFFRTIWTATVPGPLTFGKFYEAGPASQSVLCPQVIRHKAPGSAGSLLVLMFCCCHFTILETLGSGDLALSFYLTSENYVANSIAT